MAKIPFSSLISSDVAHNCWPKIPLEKNWQPKGQDRLQWSEEKVQTLIETDRNLATNAIFSHKNFVESEKLKQTTR